VLDVSKRRAHHLDARLDVHSLPPVSQRRSLPEISFPPGSRVRRLQRDRCAWL